MAVIAAVLLTASATSAAIAADSADGQYTYRPYGQQNKAGSEPASSPANTVPQPAGPRDAAEGAPGAGRITEPDNGDGGVDEPAEQPPPRGRVESRRIEATASAPDRSVPYSVREQDARRAAIDAWRAKAAERFGPEFSHWRMAERRHIDCVRERGDDAVCTVTGVPTRGDARFDRVNPDGRY
jgi:hypothetical protein